MSTARALPLPGEQAAPEHVLILSTSLLTDRMLLYTDCIASLRRKSRVTIWASSAANPQHAHLWDGLLPAVAEPFPEVGHYPEVPHNYARRLNDFVWDSHHEDPSRRSIQKHFRDQTQRKSIKALRAPARWLSRAGMAPAVESLTERLLLGHLRSPEARQRLQRLRPDLVVATGPFWFWEPAVVSAAKNLGIPVATLIPSWDNLSTKSRMVFRYDGYFVWSEEARRQLHAYYPASRRVDVHVVGAPQFDVFFQPRFWRPRDEFLASFGLRGDRPVIVYALGSPNFLTGEPHGALDVAARLIRGEFGQAQMLVRPHPIHDNAEMADLFRPFGPRVAVQSTSIPRLPVSARSQTTEQVVEWVNSFRHADVVVNLSSTVTVDAALFDRPVVNLDYDPAPGQPQQQVVHEVNHVWTHFRPVAESGGVWLAKDSGDLADGIRAYLKDPQRHRAERRWVAETVCGFVDGRSGKRLGEAVARCASSIREGRGRSRSRTRSPGPSR